MSQVLPAAALAQERAGMFAQRVRSIRESLHSVVVGQEQTLDLLLTCCLTGSHALLVGVPGGRPGRSWDSGESFAERTYVFELRVLAGGRGVPQDRGDDAARTRRVGLVHGGVSHGLFSTIYLREAGRMLVVKSGRPKNSSGSTHMPDPWRIRRRVIATSFHHEREHVQRGVAADFVEEHVGPRTQWRGVQMETVRAA
jgi:hypothetical protein